MPSYAVEPDAVVQITTRGMLNGQLILNTFHYRNDVAVADGSNDLISLLEEFNGDVQSNLADATSSDMDFLGTMAQFIWPIRYVAEIDSNNVTTPGQVVSDPVPNTVAVVIRRRSFLANKSARGRIYVAGIPNTFQTASQVNGVGQPVLALLANKLDNVQTTTAGTKYRPVIFDRQQPENSEEVSSTALDEILRSQRRREIGVGV